MNIKISNDLMNLGTLQNIMNQTVFDYVDTTQKSAKAYAILDDLLHQVVNYFNEQVERNNGEIPKSLNYWPLFMDVTSKLIYFNGLTHVQLIDKDDVDARKHIIGMYEISARCLPNATTGENAEFLEEIQKSLQQISEQHPALETSKTVEECLNVFYKLAQTYK